MDYVIGDAIAQFYETAEGAMGMIKGIVTDVLEDRLIYKTKDNGDIPDGEEHIVPIEMYETLL